MFTLFGLVKTTIVGKAQQQNEFQYQVSTECSQHCEKLVLHCSNCCRDYFPLLPNVDHSVRLFQRDITLSSDKKESKCDLQQKANMSVSKQ